MSKGARCPDLKRAESIAPREVDRWGGWSRDWRAVVEVGRNESIVEYEWWIVSKVLLIALVISIISASKTTTAAFSIINLRSSSSLPSSNPSH